MKIKTETRKRITIFILMVILLLTFFTMPSFRYTLTGFAVAEDEWENTKTITANSSTETVTVQIEFGKYKPADCSDGIYIEDEYSNEIDFIIVSSVQENNTCVRCEIEFDNVIYEEEVPEELPPPTTLPPEKEPEHELPPPITAFATATNEITYHVYYGRIAEEPDVNITEEQPPELPPLKTMAGDNVFETGIVEVSGWTTVNLMSTYTAPVVVAYRRNPAGEEDMEHELSTAIIDNLTSNSFEINFYDDYGNGVVTNGSYIVAENGSHILDNGMLLQAGLVYNVDEYDCAGSSGSASRTITFPVEYNSAPSVIANVQNNTESDWIAARYDSISTTQVVVSMERDEAHGTGPLAASSNYNIGWIAMNRTSATSMEASIDDNVVADPGSSGGWELQSFSNTYTNSLFFVLVEQTSGTDPTTGGTNNLTSDNISIRMTESRTDGEQDHADEDIMWMVFESGLGNSAPTTPTNITCNGNNDCNISANQGDVINLTASGSTDADGDAINYSIEIVMQNITLSSDQESGEKQAIAASGAGSDSNTTIMNLSPHRWWILDGDGTDSSGNGGNPSSTQGSPTAVASQIPCPVGTNMMYFDGDDEYYYADDTQMNTYSNPNGDWFAMSLWFNASTITDTNNGQTIWSQGGGVNSITIYVTDDLGQDEVFCTAVESSSNRIDYVHTPVNPNELHHLGCIYDFDGGVVTMYLDGELVDTDSDSAIGTELDRHTGNMAMAGQDSNTDDHKGAAISGNFVGYIGEFAYWGMDDDNAITGDNFTSIYNAGMGVGGSNDTESEKSWEPYNNIFLNQWKNITNLNVTIGVSIFNKSGSTASGNNDPDLQLEMYNGSDFVEIGNFSINETGNFSLTITDLTIKTGWRTADNTDLKIRGVDFDYNSSSNFDEINWTGIWAVMDGESWLILGNHTNETTANLQWNTTSVAEQDCIDFRARAIDNESKSYSNYFTKGACFNITISAGNTDYPMFSNYNVNETLIGEKAWARFNLTVSDASDSISSVNGTVAGGEVDFTNIAGTHWAYEHQCTSSGAISWTHVSANDTGSPVNWNDTSVSQSYNCDASPPLSGDEAINETSINVNEYFCINATIIDATSLIDTVYAEIYNTTDWYNVTLSNSTGAAPACNTGGDVWGIKLQGKGHGYWNYSRIWANDTLNNINNTYDFDDIQIFVNSTSAIAISLSPWLSQQINWSLVVSLPVYNQSSEGNNGTGITKYDVAVSTAGVNVDVYIKADNNLSTVGGNKIGLGNETFCYNITDSTVPNATKYQLTTDYVDNKIGSNVADGTYIYLKFFLSAPIGQAAGSYSNNVSVVGIPTGQSPE